MLLKAAEMEPPACNLKWLDVSIYRGSSQWPEAHTVWISSQRSSTSDALPWGLSVPAGQLASIHQNYAWCEDGDWHVFGENWSCFLRFSLGISTQTSFRVPSVQSQNDWLFLWFKSLLKSDWHIHQWLCTTIISLPFAIRSCGCLLPGVQTEISHSLKKDVLLQGTGEMINDGPWKAGLDDRSVSLEAY